MNDKEINIIDFKSEFNSAQLLELRAYLTNYLAEKNFPKHIQTKLIWVFSEIFSNIQFHSMKDFEYCSFIKLNLNNETSEFLIIAKNCADIKQAEYLSNRILYLRNLHSEELKNEYLNIMQNSDFQNSRAGLGLIGIVRKSNNISSEIEFLNQDIAKIKIQVIIKID